MRRIARKQGGAAAIEFAFVLPLLILILYGLVTFGSVLYTQIALSRAVEDGARALSFLPDDGNYDSLKAEVINSMAASAVVPGAAGGSFSARRAWLLAESRLAVTVSATACNGAAAGQHLSVRASYLYTDAAGTRTLPAIRLPGLAVFESWMPDQLSSCATARTL